MKNVFKLAKSKGYKRMFGADIQTNEPTLAYTQYCELTLIQKWLRDEHKIHITIHLGLKLTYYWQLMDLSLQQDNTINTELSYYPTYEETLLTGISEALKLLPTLKTE